MKIVQLPNKKLRKISQPVVLPLNSEDQKIVEAMINYIDESQKSDSDVRQGIGIAAVQIGILKRMFYINVPKDNFSEGFREFLINPEITSQSASSSALEQGEGCLSVGDHDDQEGLVHRQYKIVIKGYSYFQQKIVEYTKIGLIAIVIQHEMDHLNGKLYIDRIDSKHPWKVKNNEELI